MLRLLLLLRFTVCALRDAGAALLVVALVLFLETCALLDLALLIRLGVACIERVLFEVERVAVVDLLDLLLFTRAVSFLLERLLRFTLVLLVLLLARLSTLALRLDLFKDSLLLRVLLATVRLEVVLALRLIDCLPVLTASRLRCVALEFDTARPLEFLRPRSKLRKRTCSPGL